MHDQTQFQKKILQKTRRGTSSDDLAHEVAYRSTTDPWAMALDDDNLVADM